MSLQPDFNAARRRLLQSLPLAAGLPGLALAASAAAPADVTSPPALPQKAAFDYAGVHLNAAYTHPMSRASARAMHDYVDARQMKAGGPPLRMGADRNEALALFAQLINAAPDELAWVPSTTAGENFVASALGLPGSRQRVVTDAYHFEGSLYLYQQLARRGLDLHIVRPSGLGIDMAQMAAAITPGTRLVAVSLVSTMNGFQHDLKALCQLAHARGALVYADIIQAAGATPIDVRDSGVDFCACATYKWLMGDFGLGFLYVRKDRLAQLQRSQYGYRQLAAYHYHVFPYDRAGAGVIDFEQLQDTAGHVEVGTLGNAALAGLRVSLRTLLDIGVARIEAHRQPLLARLQAGLPRLGYPALTPAGSRSAIVSFACQGAARRLQPRLDAAGVNIQLYDNHLRVSPSFHNDMGDVERLLAALA